MESTTLESSPLHILSAEERAALAPFLCAISFGDGDILFRQGSAANGCFLIDTGQVALGNRLPGDLETQVELLGPGDLLGEAALVSAAPRTQTATARGPVTALYVEGRDLFALKALISPIHLSFLQQLCTSLARRMKNLLKFPALDAPARRDDERGGLGTREAPGCSFALAAFAARLPCFRDFCARDLDLLLQISQPWELPAGRWLYSAGDPTDTLYIVVRGAAETRWPGQPEGRRLGLWGPGRLLDPVELVLGGQRVTEGRTREPSLVLSFSRATFYELLTARAPMASKLLHAAALELLERLTRATRLLASRALAIQLGIAV